MREREHFGLAITAAETMYHLWELESTEEGLNLDQMMCRLKDLSAYSLTHAEIMYQREGVELLAIAMFFGAGSDSRFHKNQERLSRLTEEAISYQGRAESIEEEVAQRKANRSRQAEGKGTPSRQPCLL